MFPLHLAVLFGFSDCCRKLLSSGMSSWARGRAGGRESSGPVPPRPRPQGGPAAVPAPQVSSTASYPHSATSTCFQLGSTSTHPTTLAVPVFMLLLPEGELSSLPLSPRPREGVWAAVWTPPSLLPRAAHLSRVRRRRQKGLSRSALPGENPAAPPRSAFSGSPAPSFLSGMLNVLTCC